MNSRSDRLYTAKHSTGLVQTRRSRRPYTHAVLGLDPEAGHLVCAGFCGSMDHAQTKLATVKARLTQPEIVEVTAPKIRKAVPA